jgi:Ion transport protein.
MANGNEYGGHAQLKICQRIADDQRFQNFILGVILFVAVLMGVETSERLMRDYKGLFVVLNFLVQTIFVTEIVIRLLAHSPRFDRFFRDGWNVFDFVIVMASLLPQTGAFAMVARLARVLRVLRLLSASSELKLIVGTMLRSIPSLGHVSMLLGLLIYVYAIIGFYLFHNEDYQHWGTLARASLTLFQLLTLEGWVEVQRATMQEHPWAWTFFASYIVVAVFVVINLFIAVVLNNLENVRADMEEQREVQYIPETDEEIIQQVASMRTQLKELEAKLRARSGTAGEN